MRDPSELYQDDPHPVSGHRTPREIGEDEVGAIAGIRNDLHKNPRADNGPVCALDKVSGTAAALESVQGPGDN